MKNNQVKFGNMLPETSKSSAFWDMGVNSHLKWLPMFSPDEAGKSDSISLGRRILSIHPSWVKHLKWKLLDLGSVFEQRPNGFLSTLLTDSEGCLTLRLQIPSRCLRTLPCIISRMNKAAFHVTCHMSYIILCSSCHNCKGNIVSPATVIFH